MRSSSVAPLLTTLADSTRRRIYEKIAQRGEASVGELVVGSRVSQPAISQHLRVLREAGLVASRRTGRSVQYRIAPRALVPLIDWIGLYGGFWQDRFKSLESLLKEIDR